MGVVCPKVFDLKRGLDAVEVGHQDVHQNQVKVRLGPGDGVDSLKAIVDLLDSHLGQAAPE